MDSSGGHSCGEDSEIEVSDVPFEPLKVGIVLEEAVKLVSPGLSLEQYVFAVTVELLFDFGSDGV